MDKISDQARRHFESKMREGIYDKTALTLPDGAREFHWLTSSAERDSLRLGDIRKVIRCKLPYRKPSWQFVFFDKWNPKPRGE